MPQGLIDCLSAVLTDLIAEGVDSFLVGHQGGFDSIVLRTLKILKERYPHIIYQAVLVYMPGDMDDS